MSGGDKLSLSAGSLPMVKLEPSHRNDLFVQCDGRAKNKKNKTMSSSLRSRPVMSKFQPPQGGCWSVQGWLVSPKVCVMASRSFKNRSVLQHVSKCILCNPTGAHSRIGFTEFKINRCALNESWPILSLKVAL